MSSLYKDLDCWKQGLKITKMIYMLCEKFPKTELYSLVDQIKRASTSITANIAEGSGRGSSQDNIRFLYIARGSCMELESHLLTAIELGFLKKEECEGILLDIENELKILSGFITYKKKSTHD